MALLFQKARLFSQGDRKTFTQAQAFSARPDPLTERIMRHRELDALISEIIMYRAYGEGLYLELQKLDNVQDLRCADYAFYPRGAVGRNIPFGKELVWIERERSGDGPTGRIIAARLSLPDVPVSCGNRTIGLRSATGVGVVRQESLELAVVEDTPRFVLYEVTFGQQFDPGRDIRIKQIPRPRRSTAVIDEDCFPVGGKGKTAGPDGTLHMIVSRHFHDLKIPKLGMDGATGWHGSITRSPCFEVDFDRSVATAATWSLASALPSMPVDA